jgi:O-antigen/teichoic acid export membrane protein
MLREMASYGFPLVFTTASAIVLQLGDRFILGYYLDKSEVGAYGFGYKIGGILNMFVIQSFQLGFLPMAYKMLSDPDAKRFFSRMLTYFTFVLVFSALFLTLFARELSIFLSWGEDSYQSAVYLVPLITFSFVLKGMQYYFSLGLHYVKRTSYNAYIVVFCALLSIGMNIALIPVIGVIAAAITVTFTTAVMGGLYLYYSQKFYYIQFEARRILLMLGIGVLLFFIGWELEFLDMIWVLIIKSVLVILFPFLLYKGGFFDKDELNRIKQGWGIVMGLVRK